MANIQPQNNISKQQKMGFVFLLVFAILVVGLGLLQLRNIIYNPFAIKLPDSFKQFGGITEASDDLRLQRIDTDHDGVNDYDELFFYNTSPYLPDTDSDGINDKEEIEKGADPLCPEGQECAESEEKTEGSSVENLNTGLSKDLADSKDIVSSVADGEEVTKVFEALKDPNSVRKMLLESGQMKKEQLDTVSDEVLMQMVNEFVAGQMGQNLQSENNELENVSTSSSQ